MTSLVYNDGTASVANGSAVVTGQGTAWKLRLVEGGSFSLAGMAVPIKSVDTDTKLTLAYDWPGADADESRYAIARETSQAVRAAWINDRLASFHQKPWGIGVQPDGRGTLAERDALDPMPTDNYSWLRVEVDEPAELYFKTPSGWLGPYGFSGEAGPPGPALVPAGEWAEETIYARGRLVSHGGRTFASRSDDNQGNEPPDADEDSAEWMFMPTVQGAEGPQGPEGPEGPEGPQGPQGSIEGVTPFWKERLEDDDDGAAARTGLGATTLGSSLFTATDAAAARTAIEANNAENLTTGTLPDARVSATLAPDKAFRRGNILGMVSQSSGVPAGAIIERGANSNGEYVRFADGTQITTRTDATITNAGAALTHAAAFASPPAVVVNARNIVSGALGGSYVVEAGNISTTNVTVKLLVHLAASIIEGSSTCSVIAIGRWF